MKKLWREIKRLFRFWKLKGKVLTSQTKLVEKVSVADEIYDILCVDGEDVNMTRAEFRKEFAGVTDTSMVRAYNEATDMMYDRQLDRARAFGRAHIARRK